MFANIKNNLKNEEKLKKKQNDFAQGAFKV